MARRHGRRPVDPDAPVVDLDRVLADDRRVDLLAGRPWPGPAALDGDGVLDPLRTPRHAAGHRPSPADDPLFELLAQWRVDLAVRPLPVVPLALARTVALAGAGARAGARPSAGSRAPGTEGPGAEGPGAEGPGAEGPGAEGPGTAEAMTAGGRPAPVPAAPVVAGGPCLRPAARAGTRRAGARVPRPDRAGGRRSWRPVLAVAAAIGAVAIGSATVGAAQADPGSPLWPITQMVWPARAESIESTRQVQAALAEARTALATGRDADARRAILRAEVQLAGIADTAARDDVRATVTQLWARTQTPRSSRSAADRTPSAGSSAGPVGTGSAAAPDSGPAAVSALASAPASGDGPDPAADGAGAEAGRTADAVGGWAEGSGTGPWPPAAPSGVGGPFGAVDGSADAGLTGPGGPDAITDHGQVPASSAAPATLPDPSAVVEPSVAATPTSAPSAAQQSPPTPPPIPSPMTNADAPGQDGQQPVGLPDGGADGRGSPTGAGGGTMAGGGPVSTATIGAHLTG